MRKLSIENYIELHSASFDTLIHKMVHYISISLDKDPNEIMDWDSSKLASAYKESMWLNLPIDIKDTKDEILLNETTLHLFDFDKITLGHFIDLELMLNDGYIENLHKIIASIYLISTKEQFKERVFEKYSDIDIEERAEYIIKNITINEVFHNLEKYLKFRESFFEHFSNIFNTNDDIDVESLTEEELQIYKEELKIAEKNKNTVWLDIIDICSDGDVTKYDDVLQTNLYLIFSKLSKNKNQNNTK